MDDLSTAPRFSHRFMMRPFRRRDADDMTEAVQASQTELNEWLPWAHLDYAKGDATNYIRDSIKSWREERAYDWAIRRLDDPDRHIGNISVWFVSRSFKTGEIGYWVRTDETTRGVATEVAARALQIAFEELKMHRVILRIAVGNRASERVAEKLGFFREGVLRQEIKVRGKWLDHSVWGLLEHEYRKNFDLYRGLVGFVEGAVEK
ncbi:MAG: GNAT family N-acetyltransferase [Acidimicrobiia bacterium]|nr:GNAT family N-acetyltransferase [Acidimicrobiia bacterium]MDH3396659.1 GNAT family N-acetyltransferase [Acidimicrobiia bacterium]